LIHTQSCLDLIIRQDASSSRATAGNAYIWYKQGSFREVSRARQEPSPQRNLKIENERAKSNEPGSLNGQPGDEQDGSDRVYDRP
jgi:hypothetical protein